MRKTKSTSKNRIEVVNSKTVERRENSAHTHTRDFLEMSEYLFELLRGRKPKDEDELLEFKRIMLRTRLKSYRLRQKLRR